MPEGHVLEFTDVTKRFGPVAAVDGLTARVEPGTVTGFIGPNGAGKTTSLRILLGLVGATSGRATIGGQLYAELKHPLQTVGAALEASSFHPGRSAANHLKVYAQAADIRSTRLDEVLGLVGLADVAGRKVGGFSLGMRQRLGLAYTLLGDPGVLVLDEPANGLDPEGIRWLRGFLAALAREGRTVLVSSHMLAEVQQTVSALLVISRGRLVYQGDMAGLTRPDDYATIVDSPDRNALAAALDAEGIAYEPLRTGFTVRAADPTRLGAIAAAAGIALSNLQRKGPALEEVFLALVDGTRVHASVTDAEAGVAASADAAVDADHGIDADAAAEPETVTEAEPEPANPASPDEPDPNPGRQEPRDEDAAAIDDGELLAVPAGDVMHWDDGQSRTPADEDADAFFAQYSTTADTPTPEPDPDADAAAEGGDAR